MPSFNVGRLARIFRSCLRLVLLALAGLGPPAPRFIRHEDPVVQVDERGKRGAEP
jgi:hypothetical protein